MAENRSHNRSGSSGISFGAFPEGVSDHCFTIVSEVILVPQPLNSTTKTILIVEDDELFRKSLVTFIRSLGYTVLTADSAERALEKLAERTADLVLTDLQLPGLNGIELAKAVRSSEDIPVILISGFLSDEKRGAAKEAGIEILLRKPADLMQLAAKLDELLAEGERV